MNTPETMTEEAKAAYLSLTDVEQFIERTKHLTPRPCHPGHDNDCGV